jgi:1,4-dihydroxy-2-naphthoate octaprenyltransferase
VPISRQPLGELLSGVFYGVFLPVILLYVNLPAGTFFELSFTIRGIAFPLDWQNLNVILASAEKMNFSFSLAAAVPIALLCVAPVCATANIMLANNICDLERDAALGRRTLPYYLGKKRALTVFAALCALPYLATLLLVLAGRFPALYLFSVVTAPIIFRNVRTFFAKQEKSSTFALSVQNFILLMSGNIIFMFVCALKAGS